MFTMRDKLADGQLVELGGEFIDSRHQVMRGLANEFGLALDDVRQIDGDVQREKFSFGGRLIDEAELANEFIPLRTAISAVYLSQDNSLRDRVDRATIAAWLDELPGFAASNPLRQLIEVAYLIEFGLPIDQLSARNLIDLLGQEQADGQHIEIFGSSDERFHVHRGNDAIVAAMAAPLATHTQLEHVLTKLAKHDSHFALTFETPSGPQDVTADHVVLALPFSTLRKVDLRDAGLPATKLDMIAQLGYGQNAKLMMQFTARPWRDTQQCSGTAFTDIGELQNTWETSRGQLGTHGILTNFVGGTRGMTIGEGSAEQRATEVLPWIDRVFPGTAATYVSGSALRQHWPSHRFTRGSYSCFLPGQACWAPQLGRRVGNMHFCGEHTSLDASGYMEGGAATGGLVAVALLQILGEPVPDRLKVLLGVGITVNESTPQLMPSI